MAGEALVKALAAQDAKQHAKQRAEGLLRLVEHYGFRPGLERLARDLEIPFDLQDANLAIMAWAAVGPRLAESSPIYGGKRRGAPSKGKFNKDFERALKVEQVQEDLKRQGIHVADAEIIRVAQKHNSTYFPRSVTLQALANSVARGKARLRTLPRRA